jgi:hypothetical protein
MKSRVALAILLSCIIIGVAAVSYMQATSGAATQGFTLTLTGKGYDKAHHPYPVSMTLTGTRDGKLKMVASLWVKGGNVNVQNYGTFAVSSGYGALVQKCHLIWMSIKMTGQYYGGHTAVWHLCGKTGTLSSNDLPVSFFADKVILPLKGSPKLYDLTLTGTLTLN